jgi:mannose-6-phosphate isomerase-like protein (cupin superfamily)
MQRVSVALLLVIALLAGFAARMAFDRPIASGPKPGPPADIETAHAFYRALDAVLTGSDTDELSAMLAGYFVEHEVGTGETRSAEAFLTRVQTIAQSAPGLRLEIDSVERLGSSLIVAVHQTQTSASQVAGLTIEEPVNVGTYEVLRIENGKVADRWTSGIDWLHATTFAEDTVALHTSGLVGITPVLKRIVIPAGAQLSWKSGAEAMLFVEAGSARMTTIVSGQEATTEMLEEGMAMAIPAAATHRLRAVSGEDVIVCVYSAPANPPANPYAPQGMSPNTNALARDVFDEDDGSVTQTMLWQGNLAEVGWDRLHHGGRLELPAGETVDLVPDPHTLVLVSIDRGSVEISTPGGTISTLGVDSIPEEWDGAARIDAAHGAFIDADDTISLRNSSEQPVAVLLIAIDATPMGATRASP